VPKKAANNSGVLQFDINLLRKRMPIGKIINESVSQ